MRCQAFHPTDEPGPNPPHERCRENATNSIALSFKNTDTSLYIRCCEEHWNELRNVPTTEGLEKELDEQDAAFSKQGGRNSDLVARLGELEKEQRALRDWYDESPMKEWPDD